MNRKILAGLLAFFVSAAVADVYIGGTRHTDDGAMYTTGSASSPGYSYQTNNPEETQQYYTYSIVQAAGNTDTADFSAWGMPFKKIRITKTGSTATAAVTIGVNARGVMMVNVTSINASDSLAFFPSFDGTNYSSQALAFKATGGTVAAASGITAAALYIMVTD